ncbi:sigma-70 family RNA polymerase sigma factor [bacterium]|nr:sigma-70 family RNA polymerase sigma factor [bacterium]NUN46770.1 sigma-70 family RNA polymerase sigma factor [bacterium]HMW33937.1 sigma-70 family RNA polymerase sigma factor [bacterium]HMW36157.1 sigma-70 family RNA polymerase sigma factor [bacterium]HMZ04250.1 sigma-70 family RNA polymerase sigma factor [bacterium]
MTSEESKHDLISESLRELVRTPHLVRQALKNYQKLSDEEVINRFQEGDLVAYDVIVARYKDQLINYVMSYVGEKKDAEDIVQDTFVKIYRFKQMYKRIAKFSTWVYTVAGNLAKSELRKRKRQQLYPISSLGTDEKEFEAVETRVNADELTDSSVKKDLIKKAIKTLPERYREVIRLREIENLSYEEIAEQTQLPIGTVRSRINRARVQLQSKLKFLVEK